MEEESMGGEAGGATMEEESMGGSGSMEDESMGGEGSGGGGMSDEQMP
jgi:hypothetical protein